MELSNIQQLYIQTIFDYFHEQGTWPTYGHVERKISQAYRDFHMREVAKDLPNGFGNAFAFNFDRNQEAVLRIQAVHLCKGSEEELADFVRVLRFCVDKYFSFGEDNLDVTSDELKEQLNMSEMSIRKVGRLIEAEGMFWGSYGRKDVEGNGWMFKLTPGMDGIALFDKVDSIEQYLEKLDQRNKSFAHPVPQLSVNRGVLNNGGHYPIATLSGNTNEGAGSKVKVLFLAANPKNTSRLSLDEEIRAITEKIRSSQYRDTLQLEAGLAVRPDDLLQLLNEHKPHVVHFSGHGSQAGEIVLVDDKGLSKSVSPYALKALFTTLKDNIQVIILNACYSLLQAEAITEVIDCVVGMNDAIGDEAAIKFAASFYRAIGFGRSVQEAFDQGKVALLMEGIPEENTPELLMKKGIDPSQIMLIVLTNPSSASPLSSSGLSSKQMKRERLFNAYKVILNVADKYQFETQQINHMPNAMNISLDGVDEAVSDIALEDVDTDVLPIFFALRGAFNDFAVKFSAHIGTGEEILKHRDTVLEKFEELKTAMKKHLKELES